MLTSKITGGIDKLFRFSADELFNKSALGFIGSSHLVNSGQRSVVVYGIKLWDNDKSGERVV